MIPDDEVKECRSIFNSINEHNLSDKDTEKALNYLEKFKHWDNLNSEEARDKAFNEKILGDNALMLSNIDEVKEYLSTHISDDPYYWMGNSMVQTTIEKYAQSRYNSEGHQKAMQKIDSMNAEDVKKYLKDLIRNNMKVGIQIIKNN